MRYVNDSNPNLKILVRRGPELPKGANPNTRLDQFVEFRFGMAETEDPEAIALLDARPDCIREGDRPRLQGYIKESDVEAEVQRRVEAALAPQGPATGTSATEKSAEFPCGVCGQVFWSQVSLAGHNSKHAKERREAKLRQKPSPPRGPKAKAKAA